RAAAPRAAQQGASGRGDPPRHRDRGGARGGPTGAGRRGAALARALPGARALRLHGASGRGGDPGAGASRGDPREGGGDDVLSGANAALAHGTGTHDALAQAALRVHGPQRELGGGFLPHPARSRGGAGRPCGVLRRLYGYQRPCQCSIRPGGDQARGDRAAHRSQTYPSRLVCPRGRHGLSPARGGLRDREWYKNVLEQPTITLGAKGTRWTGRAKLISDRAKVRAVVKRFRAKHGAADVKKYYSKFDVALAVSPRRARVARSSRRRGAKR